MSDAARLLKQRLEGLKAFGVTVIPRSLPSAGLIDSSQPRDRVSATRAAYTRRDQTQRLSALAAAVQQCRKCPLYRTRTHAVVSDGSATAQLMFVGEAPGRDEDLQGVPFVGAAGQLLTKMIQAIGLRREDVYIANVLKDRPPGNRTPLPEEMEACLPFLIEQIAIVRPRVICVLGSVAAKALIGPDVSITKIRGRAFDLDGITVVPTFHPAYLLRNPPAKKFAWVDLKLVKQLLEAG